MKIVLCAKNLNSLLIRKQMDARIKYSLLLVGIGIIIAFLPFSTTDSFLLKSDELLSKSASEENYLSVDQVARMVNKEDSTILLIDLREAIQYRNATSRDQSIFPFQIS